MPQCRSNYQPYPIYTTVLTGKNLPPHVGYRPKIPSCIMNILTGDSKPETPPGTMKQKLIQTMFRDSEAQTDPYVVDVAPTTKSGLEILTLGWLSWNNGLPAGMNEIQTIERARQKRAWESLLPLPFDEKTRRIRAIIFEAIEINEWKYREEVIATIISLRMELAEKLMKEKAAESKLKYEKRLSKYTQIKKEEKSKKINKLRVNFNRNIRKLVFARQKVNTKYERWNIIKQFTDKTSELYAPQMRFGEDPRHWHEEISPKCGYWKVFRKLEIMHHTTADVPHLLKPAFNFKKHSKPRSKKKTLCVHATKWTEDNLGKLYEELTNIRMRRYLVSRPCNLKKKISVHEFDLETPFVRGIPDKEEELFQASLFLQSVIKGRAIQAVMFEGRVKCQQLIEELKSTHALQSHMEDIKAQLRREIYGLQRQAEVEEIQERKKNEILFGLEGKTTADMLDFLSKELLRLQDERKTHALALLADEERHKREAAEAGRRQLEEQRRREHDEMFKQIIKTEQNTAHAFLEDVLLENSRWLSHRQAREYVNEMAKKIDEAAEGTTAHSTFARSDDKREEEIVADLIHNFALPEAEKLMVRERLMKRQRNYLKVCHDEVYTQIENLVEGKRTKSGDLVPLPIEKKHKVPPLIRFKYMHLKRKRESSSSSQNTRASSSSVIDQEFDKNSVQRLGQKQDGQANGDKGIWSSGFSRQDVIIAHDENDW